MLSPSMPPSGAGGAAAAGQPSDDSEDCAFASTLLS